MMPYSVSYGLYDSSTHKWNHKVYPTEQFSASFQSKNMNMQTVGGRWQTHKQRNQSNCDTIVLGVIMIFHPYPWT